MSQYFFDTIKKSIIVFAKQFSDVTVKRKSSTDEGEKSFSVELMMGNKEKFQKRINNKSKKQRIVLPAISINNQNIEYSIEKQQNKFFGNEQFKEYGDLIRKIGNPSPVTMDMQVIIRTKYYSDMRQIVEKIIPNFQPSVVKKVAFVPELGLSFSMPIEMNSISQNFEFDRLGSGAEDIRQLETEISFSVSTFIFPPIEEKYIARHVKMNSDVGIYDLTSDKSPKDVVDGKEYTLSGYSKSFLGKMIYEEDDKKENGVYRTDIADFIIDNGENMIMENGDGETVPFVFEYDNGAFYGSDFQIPDGFSALKTGYAVFRSDFPEKENLEVSVYSYYKSNFQIPENVFNTYNDFRYATFNNFLKMKENDSDVMYIDDNKLYVRTFGTDIDSVGKVISQTGNSEYERVEIKIESVPSVWESGKILCGMRNNNTGKYVHLETDVTEDDWNVVEDGVTTGTISLSGNDPEKVVFSGGNVVVNGTETVVLSDSGYSSVFLSGNFSEFVQYLSVFVY